MSSTVTYTVVAMLLVINLRAYYLCPCPSIEVAQTNLGSATDAVLMERRPLVIVDRVADHAGMVRRSAFRLLHVRSGRPVVLAHNRLQRASARFTLVYQSHSEATQVELRHPSTESGVMIVLRQHQTLVLPPRWRFACPEGALAHELHDCVSLMLRLVGVTRKLV